MRVTLKVFDVLGREVATLVEGELDAGELEVVFEAKDLPSGVYFYTLKTSKFVKTRKMMLLR
ncbi:MAG: T9SS type A sorting domain-containing protein [Bacteroidota bacterium]